MSGPVLRESVAVQPEDVRLIRALQIAPRASFATIAHALGHSEAAVRRRYRRLCAEGVLRVAGVVNPGASGQSRWLVRVRCRPGSAAAIAEALAKRADVSWVALAAAGSEITCAVRPRSAEQRENLLGQRLPRTAAVLDVNASVMLRQFLGGRAHYWAALRGTLSPEEESALGGADTPFPESPVVAADPVRLTEADEQMLDLLAADGRASLVELAAAADLTPGRAGRRLQTLLRHRVVHVDVEIAPAALGYHARANLWLRVHPSAIKSVGRTLAEEPGIAFAAAISGPYNLNAVAHCRDLDELFEFSTERIGALSGVQSMELSPVHRQVKQSGTLMYGDRLGPRPDQDASSDSSSTEPPGRTRRARR